MHYLVVVEKGEMSWGVNVPDLPGCVAVGNTRDKAMQLITEAIDLHIESLSEHGEPVPEPSSESELVEVKAA